MINCLLKVLKLHTFVQCVAHLFNENLTRNWETSEKGRRDVKKFKDLGSEVILKHSF